MPATLLLGIVIALFLVGSPASAQTPGPLRPILDCVLYSPNDDQYIARFGYQSSASSPVTLPAGPDNRLRPGRSNRGQPSVFRPGRTQEAFEASFEEGDLVWSLTGSNGQRVSVSANATSRPCVEEGGVPEARFFALLPATGAIIVVVYLLVHRTMPFHFERGSRGGQPP